MIQEFDISITAVGDDKYLVRTERVAPGVPLAQEQVIWPVDQWLQQAESLMHDPLLGLLKGQPSQRLSQRTGYRSGSQPEEPLGEPIPPSLVSLGQDLYNKLFCGMLRDSWLTAQGVAQNRHNVLRLRLGLKDPRLQQLPWEVLHAGDRPLATGTDVTFSRYYAEMRQGRDIKRQTRAEAHQPLRILIVIAAPNDQERLELKHEVHHLQTELQPTRSGSSNGNVRLQTNALDVQLTVLEQPGRAELAQAIEQGNFQVVHYAGHSNLGNAGGDLYLVSRQTGLTESLSGEDLAGLLVNNGVKLAVFNSCRGAYTTGEETGWQEQNLAQALVSRGVPGVIAMAERIPDDVAIIFTQLLYRNLKQGYPIDLSLNRTRQGLISAHGSFQFHWALPILYMQPTFDGYLTESHRPKDEEQNSLERLLTSEVSIAAEMAPANTSADEADAIVSSVTKSTDSDPQITDSPPEGSMIDGVTPSIPAAELDELVETLEYDELLRYDDDDGSMAELIGQLSAASAEETAAIHPAPQANSSEDSHHKAPSPGSGPSTAPSFSIETKASASDNHSPLTAEPISPEAATETIAHAALSQSPSAATPATARRHQPWWQKQSQPLIFLAGAGLLVAVIAGISFAKPQLWFRADSNPQLPQIEGTNTGLDVKAAESQGSLALAQGDLETATKMIGILISQNNLKSALNLISSGDQNQKQDPVMLFLKGRAQWELHKQGSPDYTTADAMVSWQAAHASNRQWVEALTALGFAHYDQGQTEDAFDTWSRAVDFAGEEPFETLSKQSDTRPAELPPALNAYAGLSMITYQYAQDAAEPDEVKRLMQQSSDYQVKLFDAAGTAFLPANLGSNWLWTQAAISDWNDTQQGLAAYAKSQQGNAQKDAD
ncbi:MAG: CHAT domain-containing protein [Cyanobacteria bacterium P01_A01_bin.114]